MGQQEMSGGVFTQRGLGCKQAAESIGELPSIHVTVCVALTNANGLRCTAVVDLLLSRAGKRFHMTSSIACVASLGRGQILRCFRLPLAAAATWCECFVVVVVCGA